MATDRRSSSKCWACFALPPLLLVLAGTVALSGTGPGSRRFAFGVIGDLPNSEEDDAKFPRLMRAMNASDLAFIVHAGDFERDPNAFEHDKSGVRPCIDETFAQRRALFQTSAHPFVLTPGDSDWAECYRTVPSLDPIERLAKLREVFFQGDQSLGQRAFSVVRQSADPQYAKFRENVWWIHGDILFATIHTADRGGNPRRSPEGEAESAERNAANGVWMRQAFERAKHGAF